MILWKIHYISLYDKNDGSTFLVRVEYLEDANSIENVVLENVLSEILYASDPNLIIINKAIITIADLEFQSIDYLFDNKIFGPQTVRHAFIRQDNFILILMLAWPNNLELQNKTDFPPKHFILINGLNI